MCRNERRTFESLSELEQQLKSSVKRYHRRNADNFLENNLTENVEQSVETFDNSDGVILEQARRRQRIQEVTSNITPPKKKKKKLKMFSKTH